MNLIKAWLRRFGLVVAFRGPVGWLAMNLPTVFGLAYEQPAAC
jgi:hypothetical protein